MATPGVPTGVLVADDQWFERAEDAQRFGQLMSSTGAGASLAGSSLEVAVLAEHTAGDDGAVLRLLEAEPGNDLCYTSLSPEMIAFIAASVNDRPDSGVGGGGGAATSTPLVTLGCGRGMLEWLLQRHFDKAKTKSTVTVRSFELAGVATDFFPEAAVTRVTAGEPISPLPANAVLLCAWGETGMHAQYIAAHSGSVFVTIGEEMFTDPEPRCELEGWRIHASADFEGGNAVTVYWREEHES